MQDRDTAKEHRATIAEVAKEALESHVLSAEQESGPVRMWLCHRPGTGNYHYRVVAAPGMILVYGDIGDHIIQNHDKDLIGWLVKGAINSPDYLISKFTHRPKCFFAGDALNLLDTLVAEELENNKNDVDREDRESTYYQDMKDKVLDEWDPEYHDGHAFARAFYEAGGESSWLSSTMDYESGVYWTVECLKKFVELYNEHTLQSNDEGGLSSSYIAIP